MRYIQSFSTSGTEREAIESLELGKPYVALIKDGQYIDWNTKAPTPPEPIYSAMPLTFEIISGGTIMWYTRSNPKEIEYSKDNGVTWTSITSSTATSITVETGDKVQFRGYNDSYGSYSGDNYCSSFLGAGTGSVSTTAVFNVYGNIMSLVDGDNYQGLQFTNANTNCFRCLFNHFSTQANLLISAEHLVLPDNTVDSCYRAMFCRSGIVSAPVLLPAITLTDYCYTYMFQYCLALTKAPDLPATTLANYCYQGMFQGDSNLSYIKCLATTGITSRNLSSWVSGVAASGTFVKAANATWTTGDNGIPENWTVEDA